MPVTTYTVNLGPRELLTESPHVAESFARVGGYVTAETVEKRP